MALPYSAVVVRFLYASEVEFELTLMLLPLIIPAFLPCVALAILRLHPLVEWLLMRRSSLLERTRNPCACRRRNRVIQLTLDNPRP